VNWKERSRIWEKKGKKKNGRKKIQSPPPPLPSPLPRLILFFGHHVKLLLLINVSGKLPTYPSPCPTFSAYYLLEQNVGLGEG